MGADPPDGSTFDVVLRPALRGSPLAWETYHWTVRQATSLARGAGCESTSVFWISEHDVLLRGWLVEQGFGLTRQGVNMECDLAVPGPAGKAPEGWVVRGSHGLAEVRERARAQYGAFGSAASSSALLSASPASWDRRSTTPPVTWWRVGMTGRLVRLPSSGLTPSPEPGCSSRSGHTRTINARGWVRLVMREALERLRQ